MSATDYYEEYPAHIFSSLASILSGSGCLSCQTKSKTGAKDFPPDTADEPVPAMAMVTTGQVSWRRAVTVAVSSVSTSSGHRGITAILQYRLPVFPCGAAVTGVLRRRGWSKSHDWKKWFLLLSLLQEL